MEGDASSASYFLAGAAITGGTVTVEGCGTSSLQVLRPFDELEAFKFLHRPTKHYKNSIFRPRGS